MLALVLRVIRRNECAVARSPSVWRRLASAWRRLLRVEVGLLGLKQRANVNSVIFGFGGYAAKTKYNYGILNQGEFTATNA